MKYDTKDKRKTFMERNNNKNIRKTKKDKKN